MEEQTDSEVRAKGSFKISDGGNANIPSEIRKELNKKELAYILNTKSAIIFSPDIPWEELKWSLQYLLKVIEKRKNEETKTKKE